MMKRITTLAIMLMAIVLVGCNKEEAIKAGILEYYAESSRQAGGGTYNVNSVEINEILSGSGDTLYVLATPLGWHDPAALPNGGETSEIKYQLWYIFLDEGTKMEVVGIRTPESFDPR
jgi:hypothetical protein